MARSRRAFYGGSQVPPTQRCGFGLGWHRDGVVKRLRTGVARTGVVRAGVGVHGGAVTAGLGAGAGATAAGSAGAATAGCTRAVRLTGTTRVAPDPPRRVTGDVRRDPSSSTEGGAGGVAAVRVRATGVAVTGFVLIVRVATLARDASTAGGVERVTLAIVPLLTRGGGSEAVFVSLVPSARPPEAHPPRATTAPSDITNIPIRITLLPPEKPARRSEPQAR